MGEKPVSIQKERMFQMKEYTTQMNAARKGLITPQMKKVASKEHIAEEQLRQLVSEGKVVICANKKHICLEPEGIGSMLRTKINVNLGVSRDCKNYDMEILLKNIKKQTKSPIYSIYYRNNRWQ